MQNCAKTFVWIAEKKVINNFVEAEYIIVGAESLILIIITRRPCSQNITPSAEKGERRAGNKKVFIFKQEALQSVICLGAKLFVVPTTS